MLQGSLPTDSEQYCKICTLVPISNSICGSGRPERFHLLPLSPVLPVSFVRWVSCVVNWGVGGINLQQPQAPLTTAGRANGRPVQVMFGGVLLTGTSEYM